jgi:hypothetical protein
MSFIIQFNINNSLVFDYVESVSGVSCALCTEYTLGMRQRGQVCALASVLRGSSTPLTLWQLLVVWGGDKGKAGRLEKRRVQDLDNLRKNRRLRQLSRLSILRFCDFLQ